MPPTPRWMMLTETSFWGSFAISSSTASTEPETSPLSTRLSSLTAPSWASAEDVLERDLAPGAPRQRLGLQPVGALAGELAGAALVLDHARELARLGQRRRSRAPRPARPVRRTRRARRGSRSSRARDRSSRPRRARRRRAACRAGRAASRPARDRGRAATRSRRPRRRRSGWRRSSSRSATTWIVSSSSSSPCSVFAETSTNSTSPPHSAGCRPRWVISVRTRSGLRALLVDLVDGDDDRHVGRPRVVDRLVGLRLHAVVGGDDDHRDVGDLARRARASR